MIVAEPLIGSTEVAVESVIDEPDGARSGTRLHATSIIRATAGATNRAARCLRDIMKALNILVPMYLAGQGKTHDRRESGYAMAALIVGLAVMAVVMTAAMPVWKHLAQREKEEELVFRGEQIAHSIGMFQRRFANAYPASVDVLVQQRFLRKKYKDPITNDDFVPIPQGQAAAAQPGQAPGAPAQQQGRGQQPTAAGPGPINGPTGGIIGVTSKSKEESIRLYKGRSHYNEWAFIYAPPAAAPGAGAPGAAVPGRGQAPGANLPGGRGGNPARGGRGPFPPGTNGPGPGNSPPGQPRTITLPDGRTITFTPGANGVNSITTVPQPRGR